MIDPLGVSVFGELGRSVGVEHVQDGVELGLALEAVVLEEHDLVHDAVQIVDALVFLLLVIDLPVLGALEGFLKFLVLVGGR